MPISRVRSKTVIIIVLRTPTEPSTIAISEVAHDIDFTSRIWLSPCTKSRAGTAVTPGTDASIRLAEGLDLATGLSDDSADDDETGNVPLAPHHVSAALVRGTIRPPFSKRLSLS